MLAYMALILALLTTGIATIFYCKAYRSPASTEETAILFYRTAACAILIASGYLLYFLLSDNFRYEYVFSYSAHKQAFAYKISAFWAGQEGSFLLWALFHTVFGLFLSRKKAPAAMAAFCALQLLLLVVLVCKSPFRPMPGLEADGMGMNPLLQDPWMVIHPPFVFLGYAALAVPFALSIHGLFTGHHKEVIAQSLPWTLFAWSSLGAGIFMGGYWAYKVLGWGGYWAWDPVENSSLVPWLVTGALLHLLLLARVRNTAVKYAYLAAISNFVLILYGTYLTRSGVLDNFSTHSFSNEGMGGLLGSILLLTAVSGLVILVWYWSKMPNEPLYVHVKSREFCLCATAIILAVISLIVFIGMSTPLVTGFRGHPASIDTAFYNTAALPLTAAMVVLLAEGTLLPWGDNSALHLQKYWWLGGIAFIAVILTFIAGIDNLFAMITVGAAAATAAATLTALHNKILPWPAGVAHLGLSIALVGIIFSSLASQSVTTSFEPGQRQEVLGQGVTYMGKQSDAAGNTFYHEFALDTPLNTVLLPHTKLSAAGEPAVHEPGIYRGLTADLYLTPALQSNDVQKYQLHKDEKITPEGLEIKFIRFTMNSGPEGDIKAAAILEVTKDGIVQEVTPELIPQKGQLFRVPVTVFNYEIALTSLNIKDGEAEITLRSLESINKPEKLETEISRKPLMSFVWLGAILVTLGTVWAALKHRCTICTLAKKLHDKLSME
ncbi:MAG: cytochrome c biogenesis protein CcsA [Phycisphaerales bacterium]